MGQFCSPCSPDEGHRYTGDDQYPSKQRTDGSDTRYKKTRGTKYGGYVDDDDDNSSSESDEYDGSMSGHDDDDDSKSSKALTERDIANALDGWRKAIDSGNETLATFYFEEYPNIDMFAYQWKDGDSALMRACKNNKARLVFFLLTQGAAVNEQNVHTLDTALHHATLNQDAKIVDLLIKWDADPNVMNADKESPITLAAQLTDKHIYHLLIAPSQSQSESSESGSNHLQATHFVRQHTNTERMGQPRASFRNSSGSSSLSFDNDTGSLSGDGFIDETDEDYEQHRGGHTKHDSEMALKAQMVARHNPFGPLQRQPTALATKLIKQQIRAKPLPKLEAWLEKKKPGTMVPTYQKRWIVVSGAHMLWSAKQRAINNDADRNERKKFNGAIHLLTIETIQVIKTNANNKFMVKARDAKKGSMREYVFRCTNKRERDFWTQGLKQHKKQYEVIQSYLGK